MVPPPGGRKVCACRVTVSACAALAARSGCTRAGATALALVAAATLTAGGPPVASGPRSADASGHEGAPSPRGTSPFTGLTAHHGPVLAVKFDNARVARSHTGIEQADIVYVEKVEGGLSRLMGVYSSALPSAADRPTDIGFRFGSARGPSWSGT
ncbi:DUF3048 domain-containing protein [Streptomyces alboniger]|uniref:DUF3048 domain-containing protein n=1 Tax=Streptomyces alboniger TaxID=132473 RepID=UPI00319E36E1